MVDAIADLNAAVAALTTEVSGAADQIKAETAKILDLIANPPSTGVDPAAVEAAVTSINSLAAGLHEAVSAAQGALNPPAPVDTPPTA